MTELADVLDLESSVFGRESSTLSSRTKKKEMKMERSCRIVDEDCLNEIARQIEILKESNTKHTLGGLVEDILIGSPRITVHIEE